MSYTLSLSSGNSLLGAAGLPDGTVNTTATSLTLVGKNYPGYGKLLNENLIHLLENFANTTNPAAALPGQLWWDTASKLLKVNTAAAPGSVAVWKSMAAMITAANRTTAESSLQSVRPNAGDFWWDTTNLQLKVYSTVLSQGDNGWITVGPVANTTTGQSGAVPDTVVDTAGVSHVVVKFYISNELVSILSKDAPFTSSILGFTTIQSGMNYSTALANPAITHGSAETALSLDVSHNGPVVGNIVPAGKFLRSDIATVTTQPLVTSNIAGISIGSVNNLVANVDIAGNGGIYNTVSNKDIVIYVKSAGATTPVFKANGATGLAELYQNPSSALGAATKQYVDNAITTLSTGISGVLLRDGSVTVNGNLVPSANAAVNLGSSTAWFNNIYGVSIQAKYADLAERFESDQPYTAGTVVELGGTAEITAVDADLSESVFGVISTHAAYLMNAGSGSNATHPAVAVSGRVPVNVVGTVRKGDRLVSAGNGFARSAQRAELTPWNVIGRALHDKLDNNPGVVEAMVKINN